MRDKDHVRIGLTIRYDAGFLFIAPELTVTILGTECVLSNKEQLALEIEMGEYDIDFKSGGKETTYHVNVEGDTVLSIKWNRSIGGIRIKDVTPKYIHK